MVVCASYLPTSVFASSILGRPSLLKYLGSTPQTSYFQLLKAILIVRQKLHSFGLTAKSFSLFVDDRYLFLLVEAS